jgi:hypothetical protein
MKIRSFFSIYALSLVFVLGATSCSSPQKLVERGRYDDAVEVALRRIAGNKKKKTKHVLALESALNRANQRDMREAERLKKQGRPENWPTINRLYSNIRQRQSKVEPLLPLVSNEGIKASFRFVKVESLENESREKAATFYYTKAEQLLKEAKRGDKLAAREAYAALENIDPYFQRFRDKEQLKNTARDLGTTRILVKMENNAPVVLPAALERDIEALNVRDLNTFWQNYHTRAVSGLSYDYAVKMRITHIDISPELVKERAYEESRKVQDGWRYLLDENGNVAKDSLGNDIREARMITVRAQILENYQSKVATLSGRVEIYDQRTGERIESHPLSAEAIFENYAATFRGDERALSAQSKRRIGNRPQPFPSNEALLFEAAEQLKPFMKDRVAGLRRLI